MADVNSLRHCPRRGVAGACAGRPDATWKHAQLSRKPAGLGALAGAAPGPKEPAVLGAVARLRRPAGAGPARLRLPALAATLDSGRGRRTCVPATPLWPFLEPGRPCPCWPAATLDSGRGRRTCTQATPPQVPSFLDRPFYFSAGFVSCCEHAQLAWPKQARPGQVTASASASGPSGQVPYVAEIQDHGSRSSPAGLWGESSLS
jgi:hypothetical protein